MHILVHLNNKQNINHVLFKEIAEEKKTKEELNKNKIKKHNEREFFIFENEYLLKI